MLFLNVPIHRRGSVATSLACALALLAGVACSPHAAPPAPGDKKVDFNREVRPILSANCFFCHGPDAGSRQANLRLDRSSDVFQPRANGRPAVIVKGNAAESLLYQRISDPARRMPPPTASKPLSTEQIDVIRRWIDEGANYPDLWFLVAPTRPSPPTVAHGAWVRNPIDAFVAQRLEGAGLEPSPDAAPRALLRRVTLDLTGLPPSVDDLEAFSAQPSDDAYLAAVDRLLASPAFGEHRAHYWLDAARYADTHGYHMDDYRSIWPYRDYVISSFNTGKPFDQFTIEQLAGDLTTGATEEAMVATGFIRCAMSTSEGGSIADEFAAVAAKDRVDTMAKVWLGLTVGCAACHDHKFDPISQKEFYEMAAFFRNTTQPVFDSNLPDAPPAILVPPSQTPTLVTGEAAGPPLAHVLARGQYDQPGELVSAGVPAALSPWPDGAPRNRLGLAQWLLRADHPLTARVTANRFWSEIFGVGIVPTAHDFGSAGEAPSHPELLDWLAVEFRESGWNVKHLVRLMVTSSTYRQAAVVSSDKLARDPENVLLSRGPRFRMDAEMVRDLALSVSGLLVQRAGGPSVKPYQPAGLWESVATLESNTGNYVEDTGPNLYRRSLYTFWKRSAPPASLQLFDAPSREQSVVRRERTNTPLQALVTLNDVQFVEAARNLAALALAASPETSERLGFMSLRVLARPLTPAESTLLTTTLSDLRAQYDSAPDEAAALLHVGESPAPTGPAPAELAAWTMVASTFLNLDEALNK
jgi:hypothetical protein